MLRVLRWRRRTRSRSSIRATALPIADDETPSCRPATVKLRASAARTKAFSDPGCPSADPPLRTIESDMFGATAHCSSFGSLYLWPTSTHSSFSDRRQLHPSPAPPGTTVARRPRADPAHVPAETQVIPNPSYPPSPVNLPRKGKRHVIEAEDHQDSRHRSPDHDRAQAQPGGGQGGGSRRRRHTGCADLEGSGLCAGLLYPAQGRRHGPPSADGALHVLSL